MDNVIIGKLSVDPHHLFALNEDDWVDNECDNTLFTREKFIPKIMVQTGIVNSASEVRRNRSDLVREVKENSFEIIKWGKKFLFVACGELEG